MAEPPRTLKVTIEEVGNGAVLYTIEALGIRRAWAKSRRAVGRFVKTYVRRKSTHLRLRRKNENKGG